MTAPIGLQGSLTSPNFSCVCAGLSISLAPRCLARGRIGRRRADLARPLEAFLLPLPHRISSGIRFGRDRL